ncbi:hypothetical protein T12_11590, partial [Trichinella patagoniensis]
LKLASKRARQFRRASTKITNGIASGELNTAVINSITA